MRFAYLQLGGSALRKVTYGVACSLDGYIARPDGGVDWLRWTEDVQRISAEFWRTIDTVLLGRRTYEAALAGGLRAYPGARNVVFSKTLDPAAFPEVEVVASDAEVFVARLKRQDGPGIAVIGGGQLAGSLFDAGLIDEIGCNVHPVLLRTGVPLAQVQRSVELELVRSQVLKLGCIYLLYRVTSAHPGEIN